MSNSSYAPEESPLYLWTERYTFAGAILGGVSYGFHACLFFGTTYVISKMGAEPRVKILQNLFISILFVLGTVYIGYDSALAEKMFIKDRDLPGGPAMFLEARYIPSAPRTVTDVVFCIGTAVADGVLLYRFWVLWNRSYLLPAMPALVYTASVSLGVVSCIKPTESGRSLWSSQTTGWTTSYAVTSIMFNILVSSGIVYRLLSMRTLIRKVLPMRKGTFYMSVAVMVMESAAIHTVSYTFFLICFVINSPLQRAVSPVLGQAMYISPELIVLRVALGNACPRDTSVELNVVSVINFGNTDVDNTPEGRSQYTTRAGASSEASDLESRPFPGISIPPRSEELHS